MFMHLTLVPYIRTAGEIKTKPTQHSVKELRSIGIQPDVLLCRAEQHLPDDERRKIALFTNVPENAVISAVDADNIYRIPMLLHAQGLDALVVKQFGLDVPEADLSEWQRVLEGFEHPPIRCHRHGRQVHGPHRGVQVPVRGAGPRRRAHRTRVEIQYVDSEEIERDGTGCLGEHGRGPGARRLRRARHRGQDRRGALRPRAAHPYLGICLGMQVAVIDYARNVAGLARRAQHRVRPRHAAPGHRADHRVADRGRSPRDPRRRRRQGRQHAPRRAELPARAGQPGAARSTAATRSASGIGTATNSTTATAIRHEGRGLRFSGWSLDSKLVEIVEIPDHPWFVGCQFHPEFTSTPRDGHPLFRGFVEAALAQPTPGGEGRLTPGRPGWPP
jgi:CTP synthase